VENKFPQDLQKINAYAISLIKHLVAWESDQDDIDEEKPPYDKSQR